MASIVLSSVGSSVGNWILPGIGGRILGALGAQAGRQLDREWGLTGGQEQDSRLESFTVQDSKYGLPIPVIFGRARVAGNVIWASDLIETAHKEGGIGKGGISGSTGASSTSYTYSLHCAVALGQGEIGGIQTIWADSKVIYQNGIWKSGAVSSATIHCGSADQSPDPLLESWIGAGMTPAYRGIAYVVFENLQLGDFGNRLPNLSFEIMPHMATGHPSWIGDCTPELFVSGYACRAGGALPIVLEGGSVAARTVLTCGHDYEGGQAKLVVCEVDVTGSEPVILTRTESTAFAVTEIGGHHWAMAPGGRFVAFGLQDIGTNNYFYVALYDVQARVFGTLSSFAMDLAEYRQIAWIDAQRFIVTQTQSTARGVRVFARAGRDIADLGFFDVWGAGTATTRKVLHYAQFLPCADGLLYLTGNAAPNFTTLYARPIVWDGSTIVAGNAMTVSSGIALGSGSQPTNFLIQNNEDEWTFVHTSVIDFSLMTFIPGKESSQIVRGWRKFTVDQLGLASCQAPVPMGDALLMVQQSAYENFYRVSEIALDENGFSLTKDAVELEGFESSVPEVTASALGADKLMILGATTFGTWSTWGTARRRNTGDTLGNIVASILLRAGYEAGDFDVSALAATAVDGYVVATQVSASALLAPLQAFEPFDLVENDGQLVAVLRGAGDSIDIELAETSATAEKDDDDTSGLAVTRVQEMDLPVELTVDTLDATRDYEVGSQRARRLAAKGGPRAAKVALPLVCDAAAAKRIAERILYGLWGQRVRYRLALSRKYAALSPADIVNVDGHEVRITALEMQNGVMKVEGVDALADSILSDAEAEGGQPSGAAALHIPASVLHLMDVPLLRSEDDMPGLYVAVGGEEGWPGASLWRAQDGLNFTQVASFSYAATSGTAVSVLQDASTLYKDNANTVRVQLYQGTLAGCTEAQMMNGANAALLGAEIVQFQSAVLIGPGLYELSGLLRGRQGTQNACATHAIGESFIVLEAKSLQFLPALFAERGMLFSFRAVSNGKSIGTAQNISLSYAFKSMCPRAVAHVRAERAAGTGSDMIVRWVRAARMNGAWVDYIDVPLDEPQELYDLEIMNGAAVVRLFENIGTTSQTYTAAEQAADWQSGVPGTFTVNVYQISSRYGRGQKTTAVL